jgi:hypothetical protein
MSTDRLWEVWNDEAKAALGAKEAGAVVITDEAAC